MACGSLDEAYAAEAVAQKDRSQFIATMGSRFTFEHLQQSPAWAKLPPHNKRLFQDRWASQATSAALRRRAMKDDTEEEDEEEQEEEEGEDEDEQEEEEGEDDEEADDEALEEQVSTGFKRRNDERFEAVLTCSAVWLIEENWGRRSEQDVYRVEIAQEAGRPTSRDDLFFSLYNHILGSKGAGSMLASEAHGTLSSTVYQEAASGLAAGKMVLEWAPETGLDAAWARKVGCTDTLLPTGRGITADSLFCLRAKNRWSDANPCRSPEAGRIVTKSHSLPL